MSLSSLLSPAAGYVVCTSATRPTPVQGMQIFETDTGLMRIYTQSQWIQITPGSTRILTSEACNSVTYTNLATVGPQVTLITGTSVLVNIAFQGNSTVNTFLLGAPAVSGATTIAAIDDNCVVQLARSDGFTVAAAGEYILTGLTPGTNTFTLQYRASSANILRRSMTITALPY